MNDQDAIWVVGSDGPGNHEFGVQIPMGRGNFKRGKDLPVIRCCCAKMAERIEMPFGIGLGWAQGSMY